MKLNLQTVEAPTTGLVGGLNMEANDVMPNKRPGKTRGPRPLPPIVTFEELKEQLRQKYGPTMRPAPRRRKPEQGRQ